MTAQSCHSRFFGICQQRLWTWDEEKPQVAAYGRIHDQEVTGLYGERVAQLVPSRHRLELECHGSLGHGPLKIQQ